jgi:paired amphipathic helix protein Sin3a
VSQGRYHALLKQTHRLFSGDMDAAVYEENIRYLFTTESYILFTVDKLVHAIVKQVTGVEGSKSRW